MTTRAATRAATQAASGTAQAVHARMFVARSAWRAGSRRSVPRAFARHAGATKPSRLASGVVCRATAEANRTADFTQYSVLGDRFLVTMDKADGLAQSEGGILLTGNAAEGGSILVGVVQAAGEDASKEAPEVAVGNRVLFSKYGTTEASLNGEDVYFLKVRDVLATFE